MFLSCILPILLFIYRDSHALPVYGPGTPSPNATNSGMLSVIGTTNPKLQLPRTPFGVAWSCILTVFICAWTSGHPNVPPQDGIARGLARIKVTFWTIAAPELVLVWAVRSILERCMSGVCTVAAKVWRIHLGIMLAMTEFAGFGVKHGHFLVMGSYQLVNEDFKKYEEHHRLDTSGRPAIGTPSPNIRNVDGNLGLGCSLWIVSRNSQGIPTLNCQGLLKKRSLDAPRKTDCRNCLRNYKYHGLSFSASCVPCRDWHSRNSNW